MPNNKSIFRGKAAQVACEDKWIFHLEFFDFQAKISLRPNEPVQMDW
jgi:hypothetical protein